MQTGHMHISGIAQPQEFFHCGKIKLLVAISVSVYLALFAFSSLTRTRNFSHDSKNYVNVARNIADGKGITQPTLGFNQPRFSIDDSTPTPLTAQPPLYPMLIVAFGQFGLSFADSALLIAACCYGLILLLSFKLSSALYEQRVGLLAVGLLLLYLPLKLISSFAVSEPLGITFVLLALWLLVRTRSSTVNASWFILAGLATGLAFATRYALLPLFGAGLIFLCFEAKGWQRALRNASLYSLGFIVPISLILVRNMLILGTLLPSSNPSNVGLKANIVTAWKVIFGQYLEILDPRFQVVVIELLLTVCLVAIIKRHALTGLNETFLNDRRYILSLWTLGYLAFVILQRTRSHFDDIDTRLIAPAGITAIILCAALVIKVANFKMTHLQLCVAAVAVILSLGEVKALTQLPQAKPDQAIHQSARLAWIAKHTTAKDLIIGDDTIDIPFYLMRPNTISFSSYPYTDYPTYQKVGAYCQAHSGRYNRIYLILRGELKSEKEWRQAYGTFITDIVFGRMQQYSGIVFLQRLDDAYVFQILSKQNKMVENTNRRIASKHLARRDLQVQ